MAVSFLKKVKNDKPSLKRALHENIPAVEPPRPIKTIHASALTNTKKEWCPREMALQRLTGKKEKGQFIGTSQRTTFDTGVDIQRRINENYLPDIMVGNWRCLSCGDTKELSKKPKGSCSKSGVYCNWSYKEIRAKSRYSGVSGGLDILLDFGTGKLWLAECKIMNLKDFEGLKAPLAEHRVRTRLYLELVDEDDSWWSDHVHLDEAIIIYVARAFGKKDDQIKEWGLKDAGFSPYKEFYIQRNPDDVEDYLNKSAAYYHYLLDQAGMPYGVCKSHFDNRTKLCPVAKECWGGKYPATHTWLEDGEPRHKDAPQIVKRKNLQLIATDTEG